MLPSAAWASSISPMRFFSASVFAAASGVLGSIAACS
jgi:hypothetical protein